MVGKSDFYDRSIHNIDWVACVTNIMTMLLLVGSVSSLAQLAERCTGIAEVISCTGLSFLSGLICTTA